ncbi:MAG TPA: AAA family ATPase [Burkholderiales bacterium]|nr:AAA family ATPase [Burkholderiales bacterium]
MVGREQEIALLRDRWKLSRTGQGQVVLVQGEPGIGKSRMLTAFRQQLGENIEIALHYQCSPYHINSALYPIANHLERALDFQRDDTAAQKVNKIEQRLILELGHSRTDCHLLALALSITGDDRYGVLDMSPQRRKEEIIALLVNIVAAIARKQATVLLFEDAHWADPSTLEVLNALIDSANKIPLLVLITYRPEFAPAWMDVPHVTRIGLRRLSRVQGAGIVLRVAEDKPLPAELVSHIVDKTDGVPLFLEELTKSVLESDLLIEVDERYEYSGTHSELAIPATLRDSLAARLDRLIPLKEIAQVGAVLGREFSYELARAVSRMSEAQFHEALDKLTESELVSRRGTPPEATYTFKHALVRDAAYDSLLKTQRQLLHGQIAEAISERFPSRVRTEPELLAQHYTEAGMLETAIPLWQKAGELAQKRVALQEAIGHFERGLEVTSRLAPSRQRDTWELQLRALLGMAWVELHGYTHPQVAANLEPALALDQSLDDGDYTLRVLWGLWVYTLCAGRVEDSLSWAKRLIDVAEDRDSESMRLAGHWAACDSHYFLGNFSRSIYHADIILARYNPERDRGVADLINHDPKTIALAYRAAAEWRLGFPDRAAASAKLAVANSRERKHVFDFCWVHTFLAHTLLTDSSDTMLMDEFLNEIERFALDQKLVFFTQVYCPLSRAFWLLRCHRAKEADAKFRQVIPEWQAAGMGIYMPTINAMHAETLRFCGDPGTALLLLEKALEQINKTGCQERGALSNVLRLKACIFGEMGNVEKAEVIFKEALLVARQQSAKSWELRAAISYARVLRDQSRCKEALNLIRPVYDWFTEGHDSGDLQEAAALIAKLDAVV